MRQILSSGQRFTMNQASMLSDLSIRMSSGASTIYEKPRPPSSSCGEDTPRSKSIPSTRSTPCSSSISGRSRKLPWTMVSRSAYGARRSVARSMA